MFDRVWRYIERHPCADAACHIVVGLVVGILILIAMTIAAWREE